LQFLHQVQCVRLVAGRCIQAGDAMTNGAINETLQQTFDILQGSVATPLRCVGIFSESIITKNPKPPLRQFRSQLNGNFNETERNMIYITGQVCCKVQGISYIVSKRHKQTA